MGGVYYIPGAKTEIFKQLAATYEEASKLPGLPDDVVLYMLGMRDEYIALAKENEAHPL